MPKINPRQFIPLLILFAGVQALGLYITNAMLVSPGLIEAETPSMLTWTDALVAVIALTIFILIVRKSPRAGGIIMRIVLTFMVLGGSLVALETWFTSMVAFILGIVLVLWFIFFNNVFIQNLAMVLSLAGIGALFGLSLEPNTAIILLVVLSLYDIWAVYRTGHMIQMAQAGIRAGAIPGLVVPEFGKPVNVPVKEFQPGQGYMMLGSGDVVLPLIFSASIVTTSIYQAVFVAIGACVGLFIMYALLVSQKQPRMMAALPPIATLSILGYLASLL